MTNLPTTLETGSYTDLEVRRAPEQVLAEAKKAAAALTSVISQKPNKVMMNNEQYLEFEDWQTVGRFYGLTAKVGWTRPVAFGDAMGFEAEGIICHTESGREVGRAEAMCLNDEEKWSTRAKYEYVYVKKSGGTSVEDPGKDEIIWVANPKKPGSKIPKKERVKVGEEKVPLFQLRSMAQTRACAKAFRNVLAWVVVLAGYKPTPAEELDSYTHSDSNRADGSSKQGQENHEYQDQPQGPSLPNFGDHAGKAMDDPSVPVEGEYSLTFYLTYLKDGLDKKGREKFRDANLATIKAIEDELARRQAQEPPKQAENRTEPAQKAAKPSQPDESHGEELQAPIEPDLVGDDQWGAILKYMQSKKPLSAVRDVVKAGMGVKLLSNLEPHQRRQFMVTYEAEAAKLGQMVQWPMV